MPTIEYVTLDTVSSAAGVVVVIDVCRAFTTAAFAFAAGAERILLASTVEEALDLKASGRGTLAMGEVNGLPVPGFDLWNSPSQFDGLDLTGRTLVQRTTAGTQGVVRALKAERLLASSFVVAGATARAIRAWNPERVTFVLTGVHKDDPQAGREDEACAYYIAALLGGGAPFPNRFLAWAQVKAGQFEGPPELARQFDEDVALCAAIDRFPFTMQVERKDGLPVLKPVSLETLPEVTSS